MTEKHEPIERRAERLPFEAEIEIRRARSIKYRATIRDFSPEGASLNLVDRVEIDETIWIKFVGLENLESSVRWTHDFVAGVKFARPLHPSVFARLLERQAPGAAPAKPRDGTVPFEKPT
jgi:hypothetical protein